MKQLGTFPFGQPITPLVQKDRSKKKVFILGVYASAVHARWIGADNKQKIGAVAVASEPEIFWRGEDAVNVIASIQLPPRAGRLEPASSSLNGPSGKALDDLFLKPLGLTRAEAWLCDLVPYSCMNPNQAKALKREYDSIRETFRLPQYSWPSLPRELSDDIRRAEIEQEIIESGADTVITLGNLPLKWITRFYGSHPSLLEYGQSLDCYGRCQPLVVRDRTLNHLPLVHPRQAARLGTHSQQWAQLHDQWMDTASNDLTLP